MTLNRTEKKVMATLYEKCLGSGCCLITPNELAELTALKGFDAEKAEAVVRSLELDDYLDVIFSDRRGEAVMCVNLHAKGQLFKRESLMFKRAVFNKLLLAGIGAVATFIIGRILVYFFA